MARTAALRKWQATRRRGVTCLIPWTSLRRETARMLTWTERSSPRFHSRRIVPGPRASSGSSHRVRDLRKEHPSSTGPLIFSRAPARRHSLGRTQLELDLACATWPAWPGLWPQPNDGPFPVGSCFARTFSASRRREKSTIWAEQILCGPLHCKPSKFAHGARIC